jgi:hypothetical protein
MRYAPLLFAARELNCYRYYLIASLEEYRVGDLRGPALIVIVFL